MPSDFSFIDLFSGMGGMRFAAESLGGRCVFSSEIERNARATYEAVFGEAPAGDVTAVDAADVPGHDVLLAGFPCQPFSISGRMRGFEDARGTLFFHVARLIDARRPRVVLLENVKYLTHHDGGRTLSTIVGILEGIGYRVYWAVRNAVNFGLAQSRDRVLIVAFRDGYGDGFAFPTGTTGPTVRLRDILVDGPYEIMDSADYELLPPDALREQERTGLIFCGYRRRAFRKTGVRSGAECLSRTHKQPNRIYLAAGTHPTLSAQETSGRYWILHEEVVRKLRRAECLRLQGFPEDLPVVGGTSAFHRQVGNSVPVPMIAAVLRAALAVA